MVPCAMSTPVKHPQHQQHRRQASDVSLMPSGPEFWFDPCDTNETWDRQCGAPYADVPDPLDGGSGDGGVAPEMMAPRRTDRQIINGIITLVKAALKYVSPKFNDKSEPTFTELYVSSSRLYKIIFAGVIGDYRGGGAHRIRIPAKKIIPTPTEKKSTMRPTLRYNGNTAQNEKP